MSPLAVLVGAVLVLCIVRALLILRPAPSSKLPDPSKVPGLPIAKAASPAAAHAAIMGNAARPRWKFWK